MMWCVYFYTSCILFQHQKTGLGTASMILCSFPSIERAIKQGDKQRYFNTIPSHYPNYCAWTFSCILHFVQLGLYSGKLNLLGKLKSCILWKKTPLYNEQLTCCDSPSTFKSEADLKLISSLPCSAALEQANQTLLEAFYSHGFLKTRSGNK